MRIHTPPAFDDCITSESISHEIEQELHALLAGFVERLRARRDALLLVLRRGDKATALRLLHQLEGSSAMYGLSTVSQRAREISEAVDASNLRKAVALAKSLNDPQLIGAA
jgi:HPt (histidine-containing phosphotransfer) domain-containing protein